MKITILVIRQDSELLFRAPLGLLFDRLEAYGVFAGGGLQVKRDGKVIARTRSIEEYGTHAASICFIGLSGLFSAGDYGNTATSVLQASDLHEGDVVVLTMPKGTPKKFSARHFEAFLFEEYRSSKALLQVFENLGVGNSTSLGNLRELFADQLAKEPTEVPAVLRFAPQRGSQ